MDTPHLQTTDHILAERIRQHDTAALGELVHRYYAALVTFAARSLHSTDAAEDVIQDLFIRLWRRREQWIVRGSVRVYLYTAARNAARDAIASGSARARAEQNAGEMASDIAIYNTALPDQELEHTELREHVTRVTQELPPRCREVYLLARDAGLNFTEIAEVLGITPSTVRTQMGRALAVLEERIGPLLLLVLAIRV